MAFVVMIPSGAVLAYAILCVIRHSAYELHFGVETGGYEVIPYCGTPASDFGDGVA